MTFKNLKGTLKNMIMITINVLLSISEMKLCQTVSCVVFQTGQRKDCHTSLHHIWTLYWFAVTLLSEK